MGKKNLLMWVMAALMAGNVYAGEPKEPKLLKETKFDKEIKKFRGNIVATKGELIFLDNDGNIKKKKTLSEQEQIEDISKDSKRIGLTKAYDVTEKGPSKIDFKMLDENGEVLWETDKITSSTLHVSQINGGTVIEPLCYEGGCGRNIKIYDKQNKSGKVVTPSVDSRAQYDSGEVSDDGNYFVATFVTFTAEDKHTSDLVLFDLSGNQLWVKHFEDESLTSSVSISPYGNFVIAKTSNYKKKEYYVYLYNKQGDLLLKEHLSMGGDFNFSFDKDEKYAVAGSTDGELYLFDIAANKLLWKYSTGDENIGFRHIDISHGFVASSIVVQDTKDVKGAKLPKYLYLFDLNGNLLLKKKFIDHGFHSWNKAPHVKINNFGKKIILIFTNKIFEFENEFAK